MKHYKRILSLLAILLIYNSLYSQSKSKPIYVIVHGAWGGSWAFKKVDSLLSVKGCTVYRPTLTGQGERQHLSSPDIGLKTHVTDIVNTILYENLNQVILVGHSYGGMVITNVADSIPERIEKLIYIDAAVPENNESFLSAMGEDKSAYSIKNGYLIPTWVPEGKAPPKDVPHSLKTWTDKIILKNPKREKLQTIYILTVDKGSRPEHDHFYSQSLKAKKKGWRVMQLEADHNPQWSATESLTNMLYDLRISQ